MSDNSKSEAPPSRIHVDGVRVVHSYLKLIGYLGELQTHYTRADRNTDLLVMTKSIDAVIQFLWDSYPEYSPVAARALTPLRDALRDRLRGRSSPLLDEVPLKSGNATPAELEDLWMTAAWCITLLNQVGIDGKTIKVEPASKVVADIFVCAATPLPGWGAEKALPEWERLKKWRDKLFRRDKEGEPHRLRAEHDRHVAEALEIWGPLAAKEAIEVLKDTLLPVEIVRE